LTFDASNSTVSSGNAFADLLMGNISSFGQQNRSVKFYNRAKTLEPYFNDDWHVSNKLTLNLGLRVSMYGTYKERYHNAFNFDPAVWDPALQPTLNADGSLNNPTPEQRFNGIVQCGVGGTPDGCMKGHLFNPAPRIGFAFDPGGNGKTAIRGGYGVFFEQTNGNEANTESLENSPPSAAAFRAGTGGVLAATQSNIFGYTNIGALGAVFPLTVNSIPQKAVWPYVQQWHLDVQHEIVRNTVATISYVGSKGTHLGRQTDINQLNPVPISENPFLPGEPITSDVCDTNTTPSGVAVTGQAFTNLRVACGDNADFFRPHLGYTGLNRLENKASSIYHAFQTSVRHSVGGLQLNGSYTYSHSIDDSSSRFDGTFVNAYDPSSSRASSNFDQRHMLNIGYVYDLPFFRAPGATHTLLGGWQVSGIASWATGTPFSVNNAAGQGDNAGVANGQADNGSYADIVADPNATPHGVVPDPSLGTLGPLLRNPGAFALPQGLTFGNSWRNSQRNGSVTNFDMALFKHFAIREAIGLEFRAEAFNIFNHTQFSPLGGSNNSGGGDMDCVDPAAGNTAGGSCLVSSTFMHPQGAHNPRILQLGLKFLF